MFNRDAIAVAPQRASNGTAFSSFLSRLLGFGWPACEEFGGPQGSDRAETMGGAKARLRAIQSYSEFVRGNPDMPREHRRRCLDSIADECLQLEKALQRIAREAWPTAS